MPRKITVRVKQTWKLKCEESFLVPVAWVKGHVTDHRLVPGDDNAPQPTEEEEEREQGCVFGWS